METRNWDVITKITNIDIAKSLDHPGWNIDVPPNIWSDDLRTYILKVDFLDVRNPQKIQIFRRKIVSERENYQYSYQYQYS